MKNWQKRNGLFGRIFLLVYNNFLYTNKWRTGKKQMDFYARIVY